MESAFMYLDEVIRKGDPIYVRNTSKMRGIVVLTLNDNGRTHRETIPNTKFPICLSAKATPDMIRNSQSLRQYLDAGVLSLVPKDKAEEELRQSGVREALAEAYNKIGYRNAEVMAMRRGGDDDQALLAEPTKTHMQLDAAVAGALPEQFSNEYDDLIGDAEPESDTEVAVRVEHLVEALAQKDMRSRQVKNELMSMDLTQADLAFIIENTAGIVQKYAKERLANGDETESDVDGHIEHV